MGWAALSLKNSITRDFLSQSKQRKIHILCGPGNNGGDGFALGWLLLTDTALTSEHQIQIYLDKEPLTADAKYFYQLLLKKFPETILPLDKFISLKLPKRDLIIDALFGNGQNRRLTGIYEAAIIAANRAKSNRIAIDLCSGLIADARPNSGAIFHAAFTYTFGARKIAHLLPPGLDHSGKIEVLSIGFVPQTDFEYSYVKKASLPKLRKPNSHKYTSGTLLFFGADDSFEGAGVLAARAFLAMGAGMAKLYTTSSRMNRFIKAIPEARVLPVNDFDFTKAAMSFHPEKPEVIVFGPGIIDSTLARENLTFLWQNWPGKMVVDGTGLRILAEIKDRIQANASAGERILSPHHGEAKALLGQDFDDLLHAVREISQRYNAIAYIKGPGGLLAAPGEKTVFFGSSDYQLAVAGTGDVLSGVLAAGVLRNLPVYEAVQKSISVYLNAARYLSRHSKSKDSLTPSQLIESLYASR